MASKRNTDIRSLYKEAEFDMEHEEVKEIEETVRNLVEEIAETIAQKEPLFQSTVLQSGSFYEGLKVEGPNEFDFMICLEELSKPGVCEIKAIPFRSVPDPGYVDLRVQDPDIRERWKKYISRKENLKSNILLERLKNLVEETLTEKKEKFQQKAEAAVWG